MWISLTVVLTWRLESKGGLEEVFFYHRHATPCDQNIDVTDRWLRNWAYFVEFLGHKAHPCDFRLNANGDYVPYSVR